MLRVERLEKDVQLNASLSDVELPQLITGQDGAREVGNAKLVESDNILSIFFEKSDIRLLRHQRVKCVDD